MLIQEGLTQLKILRKRMSSINEDIAKYAVWCNKRNHPLGKVGTDTYDKKTAEEAVRSLVQQANDLAARYEQIKLAIERTNLVTEIEVNGTVMTIAEALHLKREGIDQKKDMLGAVERAASYAYRQVESYNHDQELSKDAKADLWYLISPAVIDSTKLFIDSFINEADGKLQIANATVHLIGID